MTSAALGSDVVVPTLDGEKSMHIKPGTMSGQTVTLKDLGMTKLRGHGRGDLIVHVEITTPTKLSREQEELIRKFASLRGEDKDSSEVKQDDGSIINKLRGAFRF